MIKIGIDIGSTTVKVVALDENNQLLFSDYVRHNAKASEVLSTQLLSLRKKLGNECISMSFTGTVGMGFAEKHGLPFTQEVIAASVAAIREVPQVCSMIDIGGEDAKVVFFEQGKATDLRMNGNCAGGTGAFIDQMAQLLDVSTDELGLLAEASTNIYPIASRCGVFSKTDVQNLIAKNICREDIAASILHAVAVQVVVTLAKGCELKAPILMCGGPLTFLPALRQSFINYLHLSETDIVLPENSLLFPAYGAALSAKEKHVVQLDDLIKKISSKAITTPSHRALQPIFENADDYRAWQRLKMQYKWPEAKLVSGVQDVFIGIDSGSTTTKIVVLTPKGELLYHYYAGNAGNPIKTVKQGLEIFSEQCRIAGTEIQVTGSCSTGYGEDLIKAAFHLNHGIIETVAHYMAANHLTEDVSFILDIGGQDMKAIFVDKGVITRMEINEACSSGCGSFIETFAKSLGYSVDDFARMACESDAPYDLGTRCTVFMNSKVKQAMREGASVGDIAAGLSYSVVKNCLYKVLRLKNTDELGAHIVVQGGTMKNDSVVHALERLLGKEVYRSNRAELMGALGCALYAKREAGDMTSAVTLSELIQCADYQTRQSTCHGCENQCAITTYSFAGGDRYHSGNRCEKVFTNGQSGKTKGVNMFEVKRNLLFNRKSDIASPKARIGMARSLNMFEEYPFWHTLFSRCGFEVVLSDPSRFSTYETSARMVMSDNICFPAKLVHSHVDNLISKGIDRIFMPFVVYEKQEGGQNSYNCPIVSGYGEVIKATGQTSVPIDSPVITFKEGKRLFEQCHTYMQGLQVDDATFAAAFKEARNAQAEFEKQITDANREAFELSQSKGMFTVLLASRPYHSDPLVQHKLSEMIAALGVNVITEDIVRGENLPIEDANFIPQWAYTTRILKAVKWAAVQNQKVQCMQITSFGCGPDAFLTDETRTMFTRHGKTLALLKVDDVSNIGSIKLRVRSVIESLRLSVNLTPARTKPAVSSPLFTKEDRRRKIIAPFFTPFISPLIPPLMKLAGYDVESLPVSDTLSCELGLKYANNEVCYPATLIVGDIVKAFESGKYHPDETAVIISQTGGQCRASNYMQIIKRALADSGFGDVPVISFMVGSGIDNNQPGFKIHWHKIFPIVITALVYSDCMAKFYYAAAARERNKGGSGQVAGTLYECGRTGYIKEQSK